MPDPLLQILTDGAPELPIAAVFAEVGLSLDVANTPEPLWQVRQSLSYGTFGYICQKGGSLIFDRALLLDNFLDDPDRFMEVLDEAFPDQRILLSFYDLSEKILGFAYMHDGIERRRVILTWAEDKVQGQLEGKAIKEEKELLANLEEKPQSIKEAITSLAQSPSPALSSSDRLAAFCLQLIEEFPKSFALSLPHEESKMALFSES